MGLAIAMFSRSVPDVHIEPIRDGNGRNVAWELEMGFHRHEVSVRTSWRHFAVKSITLLRLGTRTQTWWHLVLVATKPADAGKTSRPARDLCRKCVVSRRTLRSMMGQEGCRVYHCCRHTMVSKLKLDHNEVPRAFVQNYQRSVLPKSLRTHPDHTPHVDLSSLFVHSHK